MGQALNFSSDDSAGVQMTDRESNSSVERLTTVFSLGGLSVHHVRVSAHKGFTVGWQGLPHYVALHDLHLTDCEIFADDHPTARQCDLRGRLAFIPSGCRAGGWMVPSRKSQSFTALFLDPEGLDDELAIRLRALPPRGQVYFGDERLRSTLQKLRTCLEAETLPDRMYIESLCTLAALELCQWSTSLEDQGADRGGELAGRVVEYMEQNLSQDLSLTDLSNVAGLSRFHFLRSFRRATRETPYQHLLRRRIERAQQLLSSGNLSIAEIATAVGFKNSTRFAVAFRRLTNCTPSAFRASMRR